MKKIFSVLMFIMVLSFILMTGCTAKVNKGEYLRKVLSNLEQIRSATYYSTVSAYSPGDTSAHTVQHSYFKEYINLSDTSVGASFVKLMQSDTTMMAYCYDGRIRAWVNRDEKSYVTDDFQNNPWPFRVVMAPFMTRAKSIIQYALETKDSVMIDMQDFGDSIMFNITIYDHAVEFVGKLPVYETPLGSMTGDLSRYEIWVDRSDDLPYRIFREMPNNSSAEVISNVNLNTIRIEDFNASDYFPAGYTHNSQNKKTTDASELIGKAAPDWILTDTDGKSVALSDLNSKVLMIQFTSVNCGHCKESIPFLKELAAEYNNNNFDFVSIEGFTRNSTVLKKYKDKNDFSYKFLMSTDNVTNSYKIKAIPVFLILDAERVVRKVITGYETVTTDKKIRDAINDLM
ncbi:MAG: TlpA family protein disulfide reductase [Bacteroidales bacterium]|nr:TlpA family protein disulfide reductase [Bacteroidales bacterium]